MFEEVPLFVGIFLAGEIFTLPLYILVRRKFDHGHANPIFNIDVVKGFLERLVLLVGLVLAFPQVLIVFGALKIANRITSEGSDDQAKNYFLIGNLLSLLFVFIIFGLYTELTGK